MTPGALAALVLLLAEEPVYPLGPLRFPSLTTPGHPFVLTDFHYVVSDTGNTVQTFDMRLRVGTWGFLGAGADDQRRSISLATQRLELAFAENQDRYEVDAGYRASRFLVRTQANRRTPRQGKGWVVDTEGSLRLSPDLEVLAGYLGDTDTRLALRARTLHSGSLGFLYQRGVGLELTGRASRSRIRTEAGFDLDRDHWDVSGTGVRFGVQLDALAGYERTRGRVPRKEAFATTDLKAPLAGRLLAEVAFDNTWEPGLTRFERELRAGITLLGRRVHLERTGEAGRRTVALARRASELGYNERRDHDLGGRRSLRERLALSPRREELREEIEALYLAEVAERNVPLVGFEVTDAFNKVRASKTRRYRVTLGVPWPAAWPFRRNEGSVPFVGASYARTEQSFGVSFSSVSHEASVEVALNREQSVFLRWIRPGQTALEVARQTARARTLQLEYVYAFGR